MARTKEQRKKIRMRELWGEPSILSANLVDDPQFVTGTKWTFGLGWTNTTPTATTDGTAGGLLVYDGTGIFESGETYQVTITSDGVYTGTLRASMDGATFTNFGAYNGSQSLTLVCGVSVNLTISNALTDDFIGEVTNIIVKKYL